MNEVIGVVYAIVKAVINLIIGFEKHKSRHN